MYKYTLDLSSVIDMGGWLQFSGFGTIMPTGHFHWKCVDMTVNPIHRIKVTQLGIQPYTASSFFVYTNTNSMLSSWQDTSILSLYCIQLNTGQKRLCKLSHYVIFKFYTASQILWNWGLYIDRCSTILGIYHSLIDNKVMGMRSRLQSSYRGVKIALWTSSGFQVNFCKDMINNTTELEITWGFYSPLKMEGEHIV